MWNENGVFILANFLSGKVLFSRKRLPQWLCCFVIFVCQFNKILAHFLSWKVLFSQKLLPRRVFCNIYMLKKLQKGFIIFVTILYWNLRKNFNSSYLPSTETVVPICSGVTLSTPPPQNQWPFLPGGTLHNTSTEPVIPTWPGGLYT